MLGRLIQPEIHELVQTRDWRELREILVDLSVPDIAELLMGIEATDRGVVFRLLPRDVANETFEHLPVEEQHRILDSLKDAEAATLLNEMSPDDRTALLEELPDRVARRALRVMSAEERALSLALLAYPEGSVGRRMTPDYVKGRVQFTCGETLDYLRRVAQDKEWVNYVYIVDRDTVPRGVVSLRELVMAPQDMPVDQILVQDREIVRVRADVDAEEAVLLMRQYDISALPVVDSHDRMVGIITFDDLMDVQEEAATESLQMMSGIVPTETTSYLQTSVLELFPKRVAALIVLAVFSTCAGKVLEAFSDELSHFHGLTLFLVVLMGASGNTGSQASTLMIRMLATESVTRRQIVRVLLRELALGLAIGVTLALVVAAIGSAVFPTVGSREATVVAIALTAAVAVSNLAGTFVPLLLRWCKFDPAYMANPAITTISDYSSLLIYFSVATFLLSGTWI